MKKTVKGFIAGVLVMAFLTGTVVMASPEVRELVFGVTVSVDGVDATFDDDSLPFIMGGRTFLPLRAMADALGMNVSWDSDTQTARVVTGAPANGAAVTPAAVTLNPITAAEITAFQVAWGEGLVAISTAYADGDDYTTVAVSVLDTLYGYDYGVVLFNPTIAQEVPFRWTWDKAASYFIGTGYLDEDDGFALLPWTSVEFSDDGRHIINGETALWMGTVYLTDGDGAVSGVQKSMGFFRDSEGGIRLQLHHSSVPFSE